MILRPGAEALPVDQPIEARKKVGELLEQNEANIHNGGLGGHGQWQCVTVAKQQRYIGAGWTRFLEVPIDQGSFLTLLLYSGFVVVRSIG